jgi:D-3-phosphoglycerate dehydrogenase
VKPSLLIAEPEDFTPSVLAGLGEWATVALGPVAPGGLGAELGRHDLVWIRLGHRLRAEDIPPRPRCRILAVPTTGLDHLDLPALAAAGIEVASLRGEAGFLRSVSATAEHAIGLMLSVLRMVPAAHASVLAGEWDRDRFRGRELAGRRVGLLGAGRLACLVAGYLRAFGCEVLAYDPRPDFPAEIPRAPELDSLLAFSEILSVHATYDATTHHLLGHARLSRLPRGAFLVNTSRGGIVDDVALVRLLAEGHLAGAAIDVVEGEPSVGRDHPLVRLAASGGRVVITPHLGGNTTDSFAKTEAFLADKIRARWRALA